MKICKIQFSLIVKLLTSRKKVLHFPLHKLDLVTTVALATSMNILFG